MELSIPLASQSSRIGCCVVLGAWWDPMGIYQDPLGSIWTHWDPLGHIKGVHGAVSLTPVELVPAPLLPGGTHKNRCLPSPLQWFFQVVPGGDCDGITATV